MAMSLRRVLEHPSLRSARAHVLTGEEALDRLVRWIHSSEVLEIAPLLRGGELLLSGGEVLADSTDAEQRRYVRELSGRQVAGVAIETGVRLPVVPAGVVDEGARLGFPVIELRRVVPFVEVAEAINGELIHESVTNLRYEAALAHALTGVVADGGGSQEILDELALHTQVPSAVFDNHGHALASYGDGIEDVAEGTIAEQLGHRAVITSRVAVRGVHIATLVLFPGQGADVERLDLAARAAAESLGLALMRSRAPSSRDLAASELVRLAGSRSPQERQLENLGRNIEFGLNSPVIGVVGRNTGSTVGLAHLDALLRRFGRTAFDAPSGTDVNVLVSWSEGRETATERGVLVDRIQRLCVEHGDMVVAVGPTVPRLADAGITLTAAIESMRVARPEPGVSTVIDACDFIVPRLLDADGVQEVLEQLAEEQLAMFAPLPDKSRETLLTTLETYFDTGCNKSLTATRLRITRQALYGRLERAFRLLGGDPTATNRRLPLHLVLTARHHR